MDDATTAFHLTTSPSAGQGLDDIIFNEDNDEPAPTKIIDNNDNSTSILVVETMVSNVPADYIFGGILILCMVVGIPSNALSFTFFVQRVRRTIHDTLYIMATVTDLSTLICAFAPILVLLGSPDRAPMIFGNTAFCHFWTIFFFFATRFSLFVAMVISITRVISIKAPFVVLNHRIIVCTCIIYAVWILAKDGAFIASNSEVKYKKEAAICVYAFSGAVGKIFSSFFFIELFAVSAIIIICFFLCVTSLNNQATLQKDPAKFRNVSTTITIFTAVCIICNMPFLVFIALELSPALKNVNDIGEYNIRVLTFPFCMTINAFLNPLVYIARMPHFRKWLSAKSKGSPLLATASSTTMKSSVE